MKCTLSRSLSRLDCFPVTSCFFTLPTLNIDDIYSEMNRNILLFIEPDVEQQQLCSSGAVCVDATCDLAASL